MSMWMKSILAWLGSLELVQGLVCLEGGALWVGLSTLCKRSGPVKYELKNGWGQRGALRRGKKPWVLYVRFAEGLRWRAPGPGEG